MKKILLLILVICPVFCLAQLPVLPLYESDDLGFTDNAYYKDVNNVHDQYVGTWKFVNGTTSLEVVFKKKIMFHVTGGIVDCYTDALVGEYRYVENGVEKVNTLSNLNINRASLTDYNLHSIFVQDKRTYPKCNECNDGELRLDMELNEPSRRTTSGFDNSFVLRRFTENGVVKLKVWFQPTDNGVYLTLQGTPSPYIGFSLPYGEYILTKQP